MCSVAILSKQRLLIVFCTDIDECTDSTLVCNGADGCENMGGSYVCLCSAGLSWNGTFCEGICYVCIRYDSSTVCL